MGQDDVKAPLAVWGPGRVYQDVVGRCPILLFP